MEKRGRGRPKGSLGKKKTEEKIEEPTVEEEQEEPQEIEVEA